MAPVAERLAMIRGMDPALDPGPWAFCATDDPAALALALATFREDEGISAILPLDAARRLGLDPGTPQARITLRVLSSLDGVGLTAAVAAALADRGIPCNMVAALPHDHDVVPAERGAEALAALRALAAAT